MYGKSLAAKMLSLAQKLFKYVTRLLKLKLSLLAYALEFLSLMAFFNKLDTAQTHFGHNDTHAENSRLRIHAYPSHDPLLRTTSRFAKRMRPLLRHYLN